METMTKDEALQIFNGHWSGVDTKNLPDNIVTNNFPRIGDPLYKLKITPNNVVLIKYVVSRYEVFEAKNFDPQHLNIHIHYSDLDGKYVDCAAAREVTEQTNDEVTEIEYKMFTTKKKAINAAMEYMKDITDPSEIYIQ